MRPNTMRDERLRLNQDKLTRLKVIFGPASEREAIEKVMDFILAEDEIRKTLHRVVAKSRLKFSSQSRYRQAKQ